MLKNNAMLISHYEGMRLIIMALEEYSISFHKRNEVEIKEQ